MKKMYPTSILALLCLFTPLHAALPVVLNSGAAATCGPGGQTYNNINPIGNTIYDNYYTSECYYSSVSNHVILEPEIQAGTSYTLYLHFAEIYFGAGSPSPSGGDGTRIFHVDVEGTRILENFDVHATAGPRNAVVYRYDFTAPTNGSVTLTFTPVLQNAKVSAVEIRPFGQASDLPPDNAIIDLTNPAFPVEWLDLNAEVNDQRVEFTWSTAWETNNQGFEVELGRAGEGMEAVGLIEGAGNSTAPRYYRFESSDLQPGRYLGRIVQEDFDGQRSYSALMEFTIGQEDWISSLKIEPNPARDQTLLTVWTTAEEDVTISLLSMTGQTIQTQRATLMEDRQNRVNLDLTNLAPGVYLVHITSNSRQAVERLLIQ